MFIKGDLFIGFSLILFGLRDRKLHSYLCFFGLEKEKTKIFFNGKILSDWLILFSSFSCPPWKGKPTEYSWNRVVRTVGYKINLKLYLFNKYKNLITTCHFSKKEGTLDNGMKPFWWKYSVGLNQNLNPTFELNPTKRLC